jgi:hypothetical protein
MTDKPEKPPAFPNRHTSGMTLRDYFAGQALYAAWNGYADGYFGDCEDPNADMAAAAYQLADAMLKERSK